MLYLDYWKDIKGYEDKYSGSYAGFVRSWGRYVSGKCGVKYFRKGQMLKLSDKDGYLRVVFCNGSGQVNKKAHRLIAETFIPNPNNYPEVNHNITPTKTINCVPNIEWCSRSQNILHAFKNGLSSNQGEKHPGSKLTEKQAIEIKTKLLQGQRNVDLAKEYGVSKYTISDIKTGRSWNHVIC